MVYSLMTEDYRLYIEEYGSTTDYLSDAAKFETKEEAFTALELHERNDLIVVGYQE
jgi:hypothetical protein